MSRYLDAWAPITAGIFMLVDVVGVQASLLQLSTVTDFSVFGNADSVWEWYTQKEKKTNLPSAVTSRNRVQGTHGLWFCAWHCSAWWKWPLWAHLAWGKPTHCRKWAPVLEGLFFGVWKISKRVFSPGKRQPRHLSPSVSLRKTWKALMSASAKREPT